MVLLVTTDQHKVATLGVNGLEVGFRTRSSWVSDGRVEDGREPGLSRGSPVTGKTQPSRRRGSQARNIGMKYVNISAPTAEAEGRTDNEVA